jgi:hypothetical protein
MEEINQTERINPFEVFSGGSRKGLDYKRKFNEAVRAILDTADVHIDRIMPGDFDRLMEYIEDYFIKRLGQMEMEDTVYEDVKEGSGIKKLGTLASEIDLWTAGDVANMHQQKMVLQSAVIELINRHLGNVLVDRNHIISDEKWEEVPRAVETFMHKRRISEVMVVVFDDIERSMERVHSEIKTHFDISGESVKVHTVLVRAMRGKKADAEWNFGCAGEAKDTVELARIVEKKMEEAKLSANNVIVFLDFDGTLSDNAITEKRKKHIFAMSLANALINSVIRFSRQYMPTVDIDETRKILWRRVWDACEGVFEDDDEDDDEDNDEDKDKDEKKEEERGQNSVEEQIRSGRFNVRAAIRDDEKIIEVNKAMESIRDQFYKQKYEEGFNIAKEMEILLETLVSGSLEDPEDISYIQYMLAAGYCLLREFQKAHFLLQKTIIQGNFMPSLVLECYANLDANDVIVASYEKYQDRWDEMLCISEKMELYRIYRDFVTEAAGEGKEMETAEGAFRKMEEIGEHLIEESSIDKDCAEAIRLFVSFHKMIAESQVLQRKVRDADIAREIKEEEMERYLDKYAPVLAAFENYIEEHPDSEIVEESVNNLMSLKNLYISVMLCSEKKENKEKGYRLAVASVNFTQGEGAEHVNQSQKGGALLILEMAENEMAMCDTDHRDSCYPSVLYPPDMHIHHAEMCAKRGDVQGHIQASSYWLSSGFLQLLTACDTVEMQPAISNTVVKLFPLSAIGECHDIHSVLERAEPMDFNGEGFLSLQYAFDLFRNSLGPARKIIGEELGKILPEGTMIKSRIKSAEALFLKMLKEKKERVTQVTDAIGFSVYTDTEVQAAEIYQKVKSCLTADHRLKEFNTWNKPTAYGYRSMDITGFFEPAGAVVNIQILTKEMEREICGNTASHQVYKKRSGYMLIGKMQESPGEYLALTERIIMNLVGGCIMIQKENYESPEQIIHAFAEASAETGYVPFILAMTETEEEV